jgi:hypothetical protein
VNSVSSSNNTADINAILFDEDKVHVANDPSDDDINRCGAHLGGSKTLKK